MEEILCGSVDVARDVRDKVRSVCPDVTRGSDVEASERCQPKFAAGIE